MPQADLAALSPEDRALLIAAQLEGHLKWDAHWQLWWVWLPNRGAFGHDTLAGAVRSLKALG